MHCLRERLGVVTVHCLRLLKDPINQGRMQEVCDAYVIGTLGADHDLEINETRA